MATSEATEKASTNKVTVTNAGPSRKKLAIEIPADAVASQLGSSMDTLLLEAEIPGFRKGRAPKRLVEKRFGSAVRAEAKNQLVATAYSQAVEEHKLRVIGDPIGEGLAKLEIEDGKPLSFEIEIETLPEFSLPSLDGIAVRRPTVEVTDELVDAELNRLALQDGTLESREAPETGDYLTGHAKMLGDDGTVHLDIADAVIQVPTADKGGKGMILGILVDDFGPQLGLPKPGTTVKIKATGPEGHETDAIRGKSLTIEFTPNRADRIIPALLPDLAVRYGFEDQAGLRTAIEQRLDQRVKVEQKAAMHQQIAEHLLDNITMELPERVTAAQAQRTLNRRRVELMYRGVDPQKIEEQIAELRAASQNVAVRELKLFFILDRASTDLNVKVSEGEMNGRLAQMANQRGIRPEKLRQDLSARGGLGEVFVQIREYKTMDAILNKATITDVSAEEFKKAAKK